ncbi:MAG: ABC transporter permease [Deltaproteobacteria bacterium]|jgi:simple sugar transport system permease protein|nr:ABC transporter permease [Deltaproteobacteria bacterium]
MDKNSRIRFEMLKTALAVTLALGLVFVIILLVSREPQAAIRSFLGGPLSSLRRFGNVIEAMTPLMFTGLSVTMLYRAGLFNLSMEGGFFIACVAATASAVTLNLPAGLNLLVALAAGALAGGVSSLIPGALKVKCHANELVTSLMLNYVLLYLGLYVIVNILHDPAMSSNYSYAFPSNMLFPRLIPGTRINAGVFVALGCAALVYVLLDRTSFGYKVTMIGHNSRLAEAAGINVGRTIILSQLIGGMLAGLGGAVEMFGMYKRFQYQGLPGYGWDGVLIAIVAQFKPQFVPLSAFFLAYLRIGADIMARETDVPSEIVAVIQAVVIVLISAEAILKGYQRRLVVRQARKEEALNG